jgi:uncharacterized membrane protein
MQLFKSIDDFLISRSPRLPLLLVGVMAVLYTGLFSYASIVRWASYHGTLFDLGIMIQTFYNTSQGEILAESVNLGTLLSRFWLAHWEFIYIPLTLFYKLVPRPETLLVLQSLFLAAGAFPVFWLAKKHLGSHTAGLVFAAAYLLYPAMQNTNLFDLHGQVFATSLLLFAFYFLDRDRAGWFLVFAFAALLCREDIAIVLGMTGLYIVLIKKNIRLGAVVIGMSAMWFGAYYIGRGWLIEHFTVVDPKFITGITRPSHWAYLQGGRLILEQPLYFLDEYFLTMLNATYLFWLFGPLLFLSIARPTFLAILSPMLLIYLVSDWVPAHVIEYPYTATLTPAIFVSAIYGLSSVLQKLQARGFGQAKVNRAGQLLLAAILLSSVGACATKSNLRKLPEWQRTPHHEALDRVAAKIPADASLSVDHILGSRVAERRELYTFPDSIDTADCVFYDFANREFRLMTRESFFLTPAKPVNESIRRAMTNPQYGVVDYDDGAILLQRGFDYQTGLRNLAIAQRDEIEEQLEIAVNDSLAFAGYTRHGITRYWDTFYDHFTFYWTVRQPCTQSPAAMIVLSNGTDSLATPHQPAFGLYPHSRWQSGEIIREEVYLERRQGFEDGRRTVSLKWDEARPGILLFRY